ncbi:MAG TPA: DUF4838 domain-containing protein, partial [Candidatus Eisenbacteria bacterium]|nr:DUF4838 domain-containing protein [Candidatus Eisenbacteria bacterium]
MTRRVRAPRSARPAYAAIAGLAMLAGCAPARPHVTAVSIVVPCAPFATVEQAARAESLVHWNDADPSDDDACTECWAASDLAHWLRHCPGFERRDIRLVAGTRLPPAGDCIVLGNPRSQPLVRALAAWPDTGSRDAFRLRLRRDHGRDVCVIAGATRTGTLYGSAAFLERLGVRFYGPADSETVLPRDPVALPRKLDVASAPAFAWRGFWAWEPRGDAAFYRWMAHRRLNLWTAAGPDVPLLRKLGFRLTGGGHSLQAEFLGPDLRAPDGHGTYFAEHPEWYGQHGGVRSRALHGDSGDNLCTSNAAAMSELANNVVLGLAGGALRDVDLLEVWPLDGGRWCDCDRCRALGGPSERAADLLARLTAAVREARRSGRLTRDVTLSGAAYLDTQRPPARPLDAGRDGAMLITFFPYYRCYAHALADPACAEFNARSAAAWAEWASGPDRAYRGPLGVCEYWNVSWFKSLPLAFPHTIATDLAAYHDAGAALAMAMHVPTGRWGSWRVNQLVASQAMWSPGFDVDSLLDDYAARAYPSAARPMREFERALEAATSNIMAIEVTIGALGSSDPAGRLTNPALPLMPLAHLQPPTWMETLAAMRAARVALDRARALARAPGERARLDDDAARFAYG